MSLVNYEKVSGVNSQPILSSCAISGLSDGCASPFAHVFSSLHYQSSALGIRFQNSDNQVFYEPIQPSIQSSVQSLKQSVILSQRNLQRHSFSLSVPQLQPIVCHINGWPDSSSGIATEFTVQAACGIMSVHGRASGGMQKLGVNYVSTLTASLALQGALAAAIGQLRGLSTQQVSTSLTAAGLLAVGQYVAGATTKDSPEKIPPGYTPSSYRPPFVSADGVAFEIESLYADPWRAFWLEIGIDLNSIGIGWNCFLLRYAKAIAQLPPLLSIAIYRLPFIQIAEIGRRTGVSICQVRSLEERSDDLDAQNLLLKGPWNFKNEFSASLLPRRCQATGALPLSGLKVIESCRRIQGPMAGHLLALLGATVIRIEPPGGDPLRGMLPLAGTVSARFDALNRLKTVTEIDIRSARGRAEVYALVAEADVFLHNWAPDKAAQMQLDSHDLRDINPELVYAYAGGWGDVNNVDLPGTDFMVQAYSGLAQKIGHASQAPGGSLLTVLDVLGGVIAAQGVLAAHLRRLLQPAGIRMESSLLGAATMLCASDFGSLLATRHLPTATDSVLQAIYATRQGSLAIDCQDARTAATLARVIGIVGEIEPAKLHQRLIDTLQLKTAQEWLSIFESYAIPVSIALEDLAAIHSNDRFATSLTNDAYTRIKSPWRFS